MVIRHRIRAGDGRWFIQHFAHMPLDPGSGGCLVPMMPYLDPDQHETHDIVYQATWDLRRVDHRVAWEAQSLPIHSNALKGNPYEPVVHDPGIGYGEHRSIVKCPECVKAGTPSKVYVGSTSGGGAYYPPFYDEDGQFHHHDGNHRTTSYECGNRHRWSETTYGECWCGWGKKKEAV